MKFDTLLWPNATPKDPGFFLQTWIHIIKGWYMIFLNKTFKDFSLYTSNSLLLWHPPTSTPKEFTLPEDSSTQVTNCLGNLIWEGFFQKMFAMFSKVRIRNTPILAKDTHRHPFQSWLTCGSFPQRQRQEVLRCFSCQGFRKAHLTFQLRLAKYLLRKNKNNNKN